MADVSQAEAAVVYGVDNASEIVSQVEAAVVYGPPPASVLVYQFEVAVVYRPVATGKKRRSTTVISS